VPKYDWQALTGWQAMAALVNCFSSDIIALMDEEARARAIARMERRLAELHGEGEEDSHEQSNESEPEPEEMEWLPAHLAFSDEVIEAVAEAMEIEAQLCGAVPIDWEKWGDG
jgi:hypothetical protein